MGCCFSREFASCVSFPDSRKMLVSDARPSDTFLSCFCSKHLGFSELKKLQNIEMRICRSKFGKGYVYIRICYVDFRIITVIVIGQLL